ncbi:MAG: endonuclease/exonuclease/phosphatase family protein [Candidatus Hodarchaeota archaeon]
MFAGDFNIDAYTTNTTDSRILTNILTNFDDTFSKAPTGSRFGNLTSPSWALEERIDYIFVSPEIMVLQHGTLSSLASDHLPVVAELQLPS